MELFDLNALTSEKISLRRKPRVFFLSNCSKRLEFSFEKSGSGARIFAIFIGKESESYALSIMQRHPNPDTFSHLVALSILNDAARFSFYGLVRIEKGAIRTDASQENKNLLLSEDARAIASPNLEILEGDVSARHASATGSINEDVEFFAETRGITPTNAKRVLAEGAIRNFFDEMRKYTDDPAVEKFEKEALRKLHS